MIIPFVVAGVIAIAVAAAGAFLTELSRWYRDLRKPAWQPPDWAFGPAWTLIFALAAYSGGRAWIDAPDDRARLWLLAAFALNAWLNVGWSLLFFKLRRPDWALIEVIPLWLSIVLMIAVVAPIAPICAWALTPYLAWVSFASVLNFTLYRLNRPFGVGRKLGATP